MSSLGVRVTRVSLLIVGIGVILLIILTRLYPRPNPASMVTFVVFVSIVLAYIIEKFIGSRKTRREDHEAK